MSGITFCSIFSSNYFAVLDIYPSLFIYLVSNSYFTLVLVLIAFRWFSWHIIMSASNDRFFPLSKINTYFCIDNGNVYFLYR